MTCSAAFQQQHYTWLAALNNTMKRTGSIIRKNITWLAASQTTYNNMTWLAELTNNSNGTRDQKHQKWVTIAWHHEQQNEFTSSIPATTACQNKQRDIPNCDNITMKCLWSMLTTIQHMTWPSASQKHDINSNISYMWAKQQHCNKTTPWNDHWPAASPKKNCL